MLEALQLEEAVVQHDAHDVPKLLVEWSSPWREFRSSLRPAFSRSEARLAGEAPFGLVPFRIMLPSYVLEALLIFFAIAIPAKIAEMRPYVAPRISSHDVIYYSGNELPRTEDLGGSQSGTTARAGGDEAYHRTQTIKIARGGSLSERVVDAPDLKLPTSKEAVANLLAIRPDPGPPPAEGFRSNRTAPHLQSQVVAPSPDVIRDYTRNGVQLDAVIAPAPNVSRTQQVTAPNLSATIIPPAPNVSRDRALVAPALAPAVVAPAPSMARDHTLVAPRLEPNVVAPAPSVAGNTSRSAPAMQANVIPPAPGAVSRQLSSVPVQMANVNVVPPPVSAPERASSRDPMMPLPSPSVIAPPPSADLSHDVRRLASGSVPDASKNVIAPPPTQAGSGSMMSSLIGKIFGASEVVPPPANVNASGTRTGAGTSLAPNVVAPPPSAANAGGSLQGNRNGAGATLGSNVVAPPSSAGVSGGYGTRVSTAPTLGPAAVVPPPPSLGGQGGGTGTTGGGRGAPGGTLEANNIVPPPPSVGGGTNSSGSGLGRKGVGLGAPMNVGSNLTPPSTSGSGANAGAVISTQPGSKVGLPANGAQGALAMSPSGGEKLGLGGSGGGAGIGHGNGPGSGMTGEGSGAGKTGSGRGSDPNARGGISPSAGPGGAGNAPSGKPPVPGVSVNGGTSVITLPSFGDSDPAATDPTGKRTSLKPRQTLGVTIVATATSGGAFEPYKNLLHGEKYTTYIDTSIGTAVMEFADESAGGHPFGGTLAGPQSIRATLPEGLPRVRMVVTGTLDAAGNFRNLHVLEGPADVTPRVVAALRGWKFQPAMRGDKPVEVTAILGFGIDTNDRF